MVGKAICTCMRGTRVWDGVWGGHSTQQRLAACRPARVSVQAAGETSAHTECVERCVCVARGGVEWGRRGKASCVGRRVGRRQHPAVSSCKSRPRRDSKMWHVDEKLSKSSRAALTRRATALGGRGHLPLTAFTQNRARGTPGPLRGVSNNPESTRDHANTLLF